MKKRVLIAEPDPDVRLLLELTVERLGHEVVGAGDADAVVLEPGCAASRSLLRRFGRHLPPVLCLSIFPPEAVDAPTETVAYLQKPASGAGLRAALADVLSS